MSDVSISEAIVLYTHSNAAKSAGRWPRRVIDRLNFLHATDEIGFGALPGAPRGATGGWLGNYHGFDLLLSAAKIRSLPPADRLPYVSLVLVHEAVHATDILTSQLVYNEMMGRKLSVLYFRELSGPGVVNVTTNQRVRIGASNTFSEFRRMSDALDHDQLVDLVLDIALYTDDDFLDRKWVVDNLNNWGGLANRWPETRRLYVKKLLNVRMPPNRPDGQSRAAVDAHFLVPLLAVLESIQDRDEWDEMLNSLKEYSRNGTLWTLQVSLESLLGNRSHAARIGNLEQRWRTELTERAGAR